MVGYLLRIWCFQLLFFRFSGLCCAYFVPHPYFFWSPLFSKFYHTTHGTIHVSIKIHYYTQFNRFQPTCRYWLTSFLIFYLSLIFFFFIFFILISCRGLATTCQVLKQLLEYKDYTQRFLYMSWKCYLLYEKQNFKMLSAMWIKYLIYVIGVKLKIYHY